MVNYSQAQLDLAFGALAHPIRRGILARLTLGDTTIAELARPHDVSAPAITKHVRILEEAGLVTRKIEGREHRCRLEVKRMQDAERWLIDHRLFWEQAFDRLEIYLKKGKHHDK